MSLVPEHLAATDSILARRDARWRLTAFGLAIIGVAILRGAGPSAAALGLALLLAATGRVPWRWYRDRIGLVLVALIPFLVVVPFAVDSGTRIWEWRFLAVTDTGIIVGAALAMKTIALATLALTLLVSAPLHVTLAAAGRLGLPRLLVLLALLTYRYVFLLLDELNRLRMALRVRGFRNSVSGHAYRTIGQVTGTLIVRGSNRAESVAQAMRCRGFDGQFRTRMTFRTTLADLAMFGLIVGPVSGLVAWDVWG